MDLEEFLKRREEFSLKTFGPGTRFKGVMDHIDKELVEIKINPNDLEEWIDLLLLTFDGAWRQGYSAKEVVKMLEYKLSKNEKRAWPDWRTAPADKAIEHIEDNNGSDNSEK